MGSLHIQRFDAPWDHERSTFNAQRSTNVESCAFDVRFMGSRFCTPNARAQERGSQGEVSNWRGTPGPRSVRRSVRPSTTMKGSAPGVDSTIAGSVTWWMPPWCE